MCFWRHGASLSRGVYNTKATGTGHWPGGARRALEGLCLAIPTFFTHHTKSYIKILFLKPHLNHPRQPRVTQAGGKYRTALPISYQTQNPSTSTNLLACAV